MFLYKQQPSTDPKELSRNNNEIVANLLYERPYSCIELSRKTGLSHTTQNNIVRRLLNLGIATHTTPETSESRKKGGQHVRYTINPERGVFVCLDLLWGKDRYWLYDFNGRILSEGKLEMPDNIRIIGMQEIKTINAQLKNLIASLNLPEHQCVECVALSIPGQVNSVTGEILVSYRIDNTLILKDIFEDAFGCPAVVKNNSVISAIGEITSGNIVTDNLCIMYCDVGINGIVCVTFFDGRIVSNQYGYSGEIGMNIVEGYEDLGTCCAYRVIMREFKECLESYDIDGLLNASAKYPAVKKRLMDSAKILGTTFNSIRNFIGLDQIILSGDILRMEREYFDIIDAQLRINAWQKAPLTQIIHSTLADPLKVGLINTAIKTSISNIINLKDKK